MPESNNLVFKGANCLKQRLLLSVLSGKPVRIEEIRSADVEPGIRVNILDILLVWLSVLILYHCRSMKSI